MAPAEKKLTASINLNNLLTTITGLLIVAAILGAFHLKDTFTTNITELKIKQAAMDEKIEHLQEGVNRLNSKVP